MTLLLHGGDQQFFLLGADPAKDGVFLHHTVHVLRADHGHVHVIFCMLDAGLLSYSGYHHRIIPGDHLYRHSLIAEIGNGRGSIFPQGVGNHDSRYQTDPCRIQGFVLNHIGQADQQHPLAFLHDLGHHFRQIAFTEPFRGAYYQSADAVQGHGAPFSFRGEGDFGGGVYPFHRLEIFLHSLEGGVVVVGVAEEGAHHGFKRHWCAEIQRNGFFYLHPALGNSAGFIQADYIHMG